VSTLDFTALVQNYIAGEWQAAIGASCLAQVNPATEAVQGQVPISTASDVGAAVAAAAAAQPEFSRSSSEQRLEIFDRLIAAYQDNYQELALAMQLEMGAPKALAETAQAGIGLALLKSYRQCLADYEFKRELNGHLILQQGIGVAALITPWNWPMNQIVAKVGGALAAGCCMVLKPSEYAPFSAGVFAKIMHQAQLPAGVFNLVHGDASTGSNLVQRPEVAVVSITGSTRAGAEVAKLVAPSIKRLCQELGGKSAYIIFPGSDLNTAVNDCVARICVNSGQSCNAPSRLLVHEKDLEQLKPLLIEAMAAKKVGDPSSAETDLGPVVNKKQYQHILQLIAAAKQQGAEILCGEDGNTVEQQGFYIQPTVLLNVDASMDIFHDEVFGPVLAVTVYSDLEQALNLANNSAFGLSAYLFADDRQQALELAPRLEVGMVHINGAAADPSLPFGGWKMSGNGRERGQWGIEEYLETKAVFIPA